ncbi:MAG: flippase-like domain-containing protein [Planctomycetes bacterium]|nr:flippase-like domain-containing protein [Planctomycetota bacterium]
MPETPQASAPTTPPAPARRGGLAGLLIAFLRSPYFKFLLAAGILYALYASGRVDLHAFAETKEHWPWVALAAGIMLPSFLISAVRFWITLHALDLPCRFRQALSWTMIGCFFDAVMPLSTGGDLVKGLYVWNAYGPGRRGMAALSVLLDRLIGLGGLFFLALAFSLLNWSAMESNPKMAPLPWFLIAVCVAMVITFFFLASDFFANSKLRKGLMARLPQADKFEKIYVGFANLRRKPLSLFAMLALSVLNHLTWCFVLVSIGYGLDLDFNLLDGLVIMPLALFGNTFGVAGGIGAGEAAFEYLFHYFLDTPMGKGTALAIVFHVLYILVRIVGLPFYLAAGKPLPAGEIDPAHGGRVLHGGAGASKAGGESNPGNPPGI